MRGETAEKFVVLSLRLLAVSFAVVGILFIAAPNGVGNVISDLGDSLGSFTRAPHTEEQLWLALAFAYMVVITGICLVAQADVVRYRPLLLWRIRLGLRALELLPFPWRFSRLDLAAREDFLRRMDGSRLGIYHELLLMGKVFATLGYAVTPQVEEQIGFEASCRLADGS